MTISYRSETTPLSPQRMEQMSDLSRLVFGAHRVDDGNWRMTNMPDLSAFTAFVGGLMVGFKIGYAHTSTRYYSWLGGVHPEHRRQGIAVALMRLQHEWVADRGYEIVETETAQSNAGMCQLNEQSGFRVTGMRFDHDRPRMIYRRYFT